MKRLIVLFPLTSNSGIAAAQVETASTSTVVRDATVAEIAPEFAVLNTSFQREWEMAANPDVACCFGSGGAA